MTMNARPKTAADSVREQIPPLRYNIDQTCAALDLSRAKLYLIIGEGALHPHKDGRRTFFALPELHRYVAARANGD
jgi:hypothetical protein